MMGPNGWREPRTGGGEFGEAARLSRGRSSRNEPAPRTRLAFLLATLVLSVCSVTHSWEKPSNPQEARAELQRRGIEFTPKAFVASAEEKLDTELIKIFLDAGMDPNARGDSGETALMHAANSGNDAGVELLLKSGVNIAQVDDKGQTALHWAAQGPFGSKCVALLLDHGADPNATTPGENHAACRSRDDTVPWRPGRYQAISVRRDREDPSRSRRQREREDA